MGFRGFPGGTGLSIGTSRDWQDQFSVWGSPPGPREQARCENAVRVIRAAIDASPKLSSRSVRVFPQGSYNNRVNVRQDSDVDVGVECEDVIFSQFPKDMAREDVGLVGSEYTFAQFKNEVGEALVAYFGQGAVKRGSKAFDVKASATQVEADVVPFLQHRRYDADGSFEQGVELRPDDSPLERVINWPQQHHENGVAKHTATGKRFKKVVRVLKCLRNEMVDNGIDEAKPIPSFLIECLVFNAPNRIFGNEELYDDVMAVLKFLRENTLADMFCHEWGEVSELHYLFRGKNKWTRSQAHEFLRAAEAYIHAG